MSALARGSAREITRVGITASTPRGYLRPALRQPRRATLYFANKPIRPAFLVAAAAALSHMHIHIIYIYMLHAIVTVVSCLETCDTLAVSVSVSLTISYIRSEMRNDDGASAAGVRRWLRLMRHEAEGVSWVVGWHAACGMLKKLKVKAF